MDVTRLKHRVKIRNSVTVVYMLLILLNKKCYDGNIYSVTV